MFAMLNRVSSPPQPSQTMETPKATASSPYSSLSSSSSESSSTSASIEASPAPTSSSSSYTVSPPMPITPVSNYMPIYHMVQPGLTSPPPPTMLTPTAVFRAPSSLQSTPPPPPHFIRYGPAPIVVPGGLIGGMITGVDNHGPIPTNAHGCDETGGQYMSKSFSFMENPMGAATTCSSCPMTDSYSDECQSDNYYYVNKRNRVVATSISKTNIYIRGLDENTSDQDLYDMCEKYGEIKSTKAIVDKQTNKCKGYGFVDFRREEDAKAALAEMKKEQRDVQLAKQREQDPTNLYFANLPGDIDEACLNSLLKTRFGANVCSTRVMREKNGESKGVGFARIDNNKLCHKIIQELNGQPFPDNENKNRLIMVKLADSCMIIRPPKQQQQQQQQQKQQQQKPANEATSLDTTTHSQSGMPFAAQTTTSLIMENSPNLIQSPLQLRATMGPNFVHCMGCSGGGGGCQEQPQQQQQQQSYASNGSTTTNGQNQVVPTHHSMHQSVQHPFIVVQQQQPVHHHQIYAAATSQQSHQYEMMSPHQFAHNFPPQYAQAQYSQPINLPAAAYSIHFPQSPPQYVAPNLVPMHLAKSPSFRSTQAT